VIFGYLGIKVPTRNREDFFNTIGASERVLGRIDLRPTVNPVPRYLIPV